MRKLLLFAIFLGSFSSHSQNLLPPPPNGVNPIYALDMDNDGFAEFNFPVCIYDFWLPLYFIPVSGQDLSGYTLTAQTSLEVPIGPLYTNVVAFSEYAAIHFEYNGNGPEFIPWAPWYFPVGHYGGLILKTLPYDGDLDNDGISNTDEDTNRNGNIYDDDSDNDGLWNFMDHVGNLDVAQYQSNAIAIYPNPASDFLNINSDFPLEEITIRIYSMNGNLVFTQQAPSKTINVSNLASGIYQMHFQTKDDFQVQKLIIK